MVFICTTCTRKRGVCMAGLDDLSTTNTRVIYTRGLGNAKHNLWAIDKYIHSYKGTIHNTSSTVAQRESQQISPACDELACINTEYT